ncbi:MAG: M28 family peptidase [Hymenobacteraceae bacterium]|nr:M28 family peptidase [Hymenobacteraceae bacterium]
MKITKFLIGLSFLTFAQGAVAQALEVKKTVSKPLNKVKPQDLRAHIQYLADDRLLGRKPGTDGYQMAVDYVVDRFKEMGVQPGGENQTYLQLVRLRNSVPANDAVLTARHENGNVQSLALGQDFSVYPNPEERQVTVEAPLVFAGYGISAPDLGYDDYANIDAAGKIVVVLRGAPEGFPSTVASYSMDLQTILRNAANNGAVGVIVGSTNPRAGVPNLQRGVHSVMGANGKVANSRTFVSDQIKLLANVNHGTLQGFMTQAGLDLDSTVASMRKGVPASAPLRTSVSAKYGSNHEDFDSYNVVGKVTGSDPQLKNEYVVHSAHLDHVGIGTPVDGDSIYNGAHDNASGVASVLGIAKIYSRLKAKDKPKRSVLFVLVTAEEMGLLGSAYFASHPTVPKESMVANINTDMPTLIAPLLSVVPLGANHSSLEAPVANAAQQLGISVEADPEPEQNRFIRSDQYSFVVQGVPALHIKYGNKTADGKNNLDELVKEWRPKYYHKPQDELNDTFDFDAAKKYVQLNFLISYQVAQNPQRPTWNVGDFFGARFNQ